MSEKKINDFFRRNYSMNLEKKKEIALKQDINILDGTNGLSACSANFKRIHGIFLLFAQEKNPRAFMFPEELFLHSVWKDFGRGGERSGGNIIHLVRELKGLGYKEAIEFILDYTVGNRYQSAIPFPKRRKKSQTPQDNQTDIF